MALDDGSLSIWDAHKSQEHHTFPAVHSGPCTQLAFSPYNNLLVATVGIDKKLALYDTANKLLVVFMLFDDSFVSVMFVSKTLKIFQLGKSVYK